MSTRIDSSRDARHMFELARLYELSPDMLCVISAEGNFERTSPAVSEILGWADEELVGQSFLAGVHPEDRERTAGALGKLAETPGRHSFESRHRRKDETYVSLSWTMSAEAGTGRLFGVARDMSAHKSLQARLEELEKNDAAGSAKTEFLASMNHELRTPLNAILGYTELLVSDPTLSAHHREGLESIRRSGEHLLLLISDILDFAKLDAQKLTLKPREFLLPSFLRTITELFDDKARQKGITFLYQQTSRLPAAISCDETRLRQVLVNLLSNAIKFTKTGGVILKSGYEGARLRFQIEDTGIGIPPSHIEAIFRPFEQIHQDQSQVEGTGLGLSISSGLVKLMGGVLHVKSEVGKGSTFWFDIEPEVVTNWRDPERAQPSLMGYEGPTKKLLIVDNEDERRAALGKMLAAAGFHVALAGDKDEAIALARAEVPDLVFMDLPLPSPDGFETIRRVRELSGLKCVPIIALWASTFGDEDMDDGAGDEAGKGARNGAGADERGPDRLVMQTDKILELVNEHLGLVWRYQPEASERRSASAPVPAVAETPEPDISLGKTELQAIYDAAIIGDIREILVILEKAGIDGSAVHQGRPPSLGVELYVLAKGFQGKQIREKLKPYLQ